MKFIGHPVEHDFLLLLCSVCPLNNNGKLLNFLNLQQNIKSFYVENSLTGDKNGNWKK